jgi:hypothetical protein
MPCESDEGRGKDIGYVSKKRGRRPFPSPAGNGESL